MNEKEIIRWLWEKGYFWCPTFQNNYFQWRDVSRFSLKGQATRHAIKLCQSFNHGAINSLTETMYEEPHLITGQMGDATVLYMQSHRCPLPDIIPHPNTVLDYENYDLRDAVQRMQNAGSGSWPHACHKEAITFRVDDRKMPQTLRGQWPAIQRDVVTDYRKRGVALAWDVDDGSPHIKISWENLDRIGKNVIGLAEYNDGTCGDSVFCKLDPSYYPNNDQIRQLLEHELGHCMNLPHVSGGIMNASITHGWVGFVDSDPSVPRLQRYFGTEPIDHPTPPQDPDDSKVKIDGVSKVVFDGKVVAQFVFTPYIPL